ncbi:MAG: YgjV family protein [Bryobacter sp.]|nr:YgjV family protein [Bryobacter sp.]
MQPKLEWIGWVATAAFTSSYFTKNPFIIRLIQAGAASLWLAYGFIIGAQPVIVANVLVLAAALLTLRRSQSQA